MVVRTTSRQDGLHAMRTVMAEGVARRRGAGIDLTYRGTGSSRNA
jgi:hypothetical protein